MEKRRLSRKRNMPAESMSEAYLLPFPENMKERDLTKKLNIKRTYSEMKI
jgi:hypothetical protein